MNHDPKRWASVKPCDPDDVARHEPPARVSTAGVDRRMLDRIGDEVARATAIMRDALASHFAHTHGGEEVLMLEGVFQDERGDHPAGSYVRNPPTSRHTPGSAPGGVLFVKLWQSDLQDRTSVRSDAQALVYRRAQDRPGVVVPSTACRSPLSASASRS